MLRTWSLAPLGTWGDRDAILSEKRAVFMEMENKVVLTIGSTAGIGKAIAETFAANGATAITGQILYVDGGASLG